VFGADAGVVQPGADRMCLGDLAVGVLQQVGAVAVQHAGRAGRQRRRVPARGQARARGFDADEPRAGMRDVGIEQTHRVAAAAHAGNHGVGLAARLLGHLPQAFVADDALEVAHHHRIRVRAGHGADDVEGVFDVGHPVAQRFVERVLQRPAARIHRHHRRAQQVHAVDVGALALDVLAAHVDHALHAVARADGGGGHPMLAGAGFGDHAPLAHAPRQQRLADGVVDLVRAGVVEVFALEVDLRAADLAAQSCGVIDRARAADEVLQFVLELGHEFGVAAVAGVGGFKFMQRVDQRFGDESAAVGPEMPAGVGLLVVQHGCSSCGARAAAISFRGGGRLRVPPGRTGASARRS